MDTEKQKSIDTELRIAHIDQCEFPIRIQDVHGYSVLVLPSNLQKYFDDGYHAVRIQSTEVAKSLPSFGGKTASSHSLLPHQDHFPSDVRRFLSLSKEENTSRGSGTYIVHPNTVRNSTPSLVRYFKENREKLLTVFQYDQSFQIPEADLLHCFENSNGIDDIVLKNMHESTYEEIRLFAYTGILTYLIQGEYADIEVKQFIEENSDSVFVETWESGGVFILDNSRVFHGRVGGNTVPLKRNWLVSA